MASALSALIWLPAATGEVGKHELTTCSWTWVTMMPESCQRRITSTKVRTEGTYAGVAPDSSAPVEYSICARPAASILFHSGCWSIGNQDFSSSHWLFTELQHSTPVILAVHRHMTIKPR